MPDPSSFEALLGALAHAPDEPVARLPAAGDRIGRYELGELLGKGGMGAVFRARDHVLGRDVALKVLLVGARGSVDRFRREVIALAAVKHTNVVGVHDAGIDGDVPFVVLDLVEGQTLRARLAAGRIAPPAVLRLARELAAGLGAAHAVGVVHRDLKPENVLFDAAGTAKIVDFGLARLTERDNDPELGLTESGALLGTAHYMAPEQVRGERVDHRADLFALGAVIYEALTGRRAFEARSRAEVITAVLRDAPPADPALLADPLARRLLGVALRCLDKDPARRFQTAADVEAALADDAPVAAVETVPQTRYASSSGAHIAYQVVSPAGPPTLVAAAPFISNMEVIWEQPDASAWLRAHAAFSHFIHYDRRGVGMSDPIAPECTIDDRVEDLRAVLDAERVDRTFLFGLSEGGPTCIAFAAKYPERTRGLVLFGSFCRLTRGDGYPHGEPRAGYQPLIDKWVERWGTAKTLSLPMFVHSRAQDPAFIAWGTRFERQCASPGTVRRLLEMQFAIDVREHLPRVRCPVLVIHRAQDPAIRIEHGRYLAEHIAGARFLELPGVDHVPWVGDSVLDQVRALVTAP